MNKSTGRKIERSFQSSLTSIQIVVLFCMLCSGLFSLLSVLTLNTFQLNELLKTTKHDDSLVHLKGRSSMVMQQNVTVFTEHEYTRNASSSPFNFQDLEIWRNPKSENYRTCIDRMKKEKRNFVATDGFIIPHANGGLNQMKLGISDMVVIAKTLNATLILPSLDHNSYWNDPSTFQDIFDFENFVEVLREDVTILDSLPPEFALIVPYDKNPVSWSKLSYYRDMKKLLKKYKVIKFLHSDSRLANNIDGSMQRLRCRTMYKALKYKKEIEDLGMKLVDRIKNNTEEPFIALHLRSEKDMLSFTGCSHNLTEVEHEELERMRYSTQHWKEKKINGVVQRLKGNCPMTPREVAEFLEAMGYPSTTKIYLVGGQVFGEQGTKPLQQKFHNLVSKTSLATKEELATFKNYQNQLAALDYVVSLHSDVFIYSYDGNMARALKGHRKFEGFRRTISPDRKSFVKLIDELDKGLITREHFTSTVKSLHENRIGAPIIRKISPNQLHPKLEENFYSNPFPGCICHGTKSI